MNLYWASVCTIPERWALTIWMVFWMSMSQSSPSKRHQKSLRTCSLRHSPATPPKAVRVEVSRELSPSLRSLHSSMDLLSLFPAQHLSSLVLEPEPKLGEGRSYSKWTRCRDPATATQQGRYNLLSAAAGSLPRYPIVFTPLQLDSRAQPCWVGQFTARSFGVLLPLVEIVSTIISMTIIVPVRPIPALQGKDRQKSEQRSS